jgi:hypothetical protein
VAEQLAIDWSAPVQRLPEAAISVQKVELVADRRQQERKAAPFIASDDDLPAIFFEKPAEDANAQTK